MDRAAGSRPFGRGLERHVQITLDRSPGHAQMAFNLSDRPVFGPIEAMQVVDLIGSEHVLNPFMGQNRPFRQKVVVCKMAAR